MQHLTRWHCMHSMVTSIPKHDLCALDDASPGPPLTNSSLLIREEKEGKLILIRHLLKYIILQNTGLLEELVGFIYRERTD